MHHDQSEVRSVMTFPVQLHYAVLALLLYSVGNVTSDQRHPFPLACTMGRASERNFIRSTKTNTGPS